MLWFSRYWHHRSGGRQRRHQGWLGHRSSSFHIAQILHLPSLLHRQGAADATGSCDPRSVCLGEPDVQLATGNATTAPGSVLLMGLRGQHWETCHNLRRHGTVCHQNSGRKSSQQHDTVALQPGTGQTRHNSRQFPSCKLPEIQQGVSPVGCPSYGTASKYVLDVVIHHQPRAQANRGANAQLVGRCHWHIFLGCNVMKKLV